MTQTTAKLDQKIWAIAWPMMISSISIPLLGLVDTALLGHLSSPRYLGAVAIGANFIGLLYWSFGFLRMGTTSLVSRCTDQAKSAESRDAVIFRSIVVGIVASILVLLIAPSFTNNVVLLMNASSDVSPFATEYINIRFISAPAALVTYAITGWLVGIQNTRAALVLAVTANGINILLDVVFILGLGMQSAGAAWATVIAEYCSLILGGYFLFRYSQFFSWKKWKVWLILRHFKDMLLLNYHLMVRTLLLLLTFNFFTAQGAANSDTILAANAILLQLALFSAYVMDGFTYSAEALCGEARGANKQTTFQHTAIRCGIWILSTGLLFCAAFYFFSDYFISLFSNTPEIIEVASNYSVWLAIMPLAGCLAYLLDGVFIGAGATRAMHFTMWFSTVLVFLPCWWLTLEIWGNHGLWFSFIAFNFARGLSLLACYPSIWKDQPASSS